MAAGGGSMLFFRSGMFVVGPESAGADPGPVCYMKGRLGIVSRHEKTVLLPNPFDEILSSVSCMELL